MLAKNLRAIKYLSLLAIVATIIAGCGGGGGAPSDPVVINTPPQMTLVSPSTGTATLDASVSQSMDVTFKADDVNGGTLRYTATWDNGTVTPSEGTVTAGQEKTLSFNAPAYNGKCTLTLAITDNDGATDVKTVEINVINTIAPPTQLRIDSLDISKDPVAPGESVTVTAGITNPGGRPLTYSWQTSYGKIVGTGSIATWTAPQEPGIYGVYLIVSDGTDSQKSGISTTVSQGQGGLKGEYYTVSWDKGVRVKFDYKKFERTDALININWGKGSPDPSLSGDKFGVIWTGLIKAEEAGEYKFRAFADDGVRMKIMNDSSQWIDVIPDNDQNWANHDLGAWLPATVVPVHLDGGKWYPVHIEYYEDKSDAFITLYWTPPGGTEEIVPQSVLKPE